MKRILTALLVLLISGFVPFNVYAIDYIFTTIDYPGAYFGTVPNGIDGNNIVGLYSDGYNTHGFLATPVGPQPSPDIKANNSDGPISIKPSDLLSVTVQLNAMGYTVNADWWVVANTPMGA